MRIRVQVMPREVYKIYKEQVQGAKDIRD